MGVPLLFYYYYNFFPKFYLFKFGLSYFQTKYPGEKKHSSQLGLRQLVFVLVLGITHL